jgi:integrase
VAIRRSDGRVDNFGPRKCPEDWGVGKLGVAKATIRASEIAQQLRNGSLSRESVVAETVWEFAQRMRAKENNRDSTERRWRHATSHWRESLGAVDVRALTRRDVEDWYEAFLRDTEFESSGINLVLSKAKWVLSRLHTEGLTASDLSAVCRSIPVAGKVRANITIGHLRAAFAGPWRGNVYFAVLCATGMRRGELEQAQPSQWQPPFLVLSPEHTKTKSGRVVPIPAALHDSLAALLGNAKSPPHYGRVAQQGFGVCGIEGETIHSLRRMVISDMARLGIRRGVIKALVGHTGGDMTDHYDGAAGDETLQAVERYWAECVRVVYEQSAEEAKL